MKDIVIVGAGGLGREVLWLLQEINTAEHCWNIIGFYDDSFGQGLMVEGFPILGKIEDLVFQTQNVVCAISDPKTKSNILHKLESSNNTFPCIIHPNIRLHPSTVLGIGTIIFGNSYLSVNISVGKCALICYGCTIGHDAIIGDYCSVLPGANISGRVKLNTGVLVGTGSQIIQNLTVGSNSIIGAGAVVVTDVPEKVIYVGIPAKELKKNLN